MPPTFIRFKQRLGGLSFRTGIVVAILCVISYIVSFAQMLLPLSATTKGVLQAAVLFPFKLFDGEARHDLHVRRSGAHTGIDGTVVLLSCLG